MTSKLRNNLSKPEMIFLFITLFFGIIYSIVQPLFIEPDSSYHFDTSMYLSNTVVDRSAIGFSGEDYQSEPIPFTKVSDMLANGTYFHNFFETKLSLIPKQQADHRISQWFGTDKDLTWSKDIMHIIPSLGVKLGYKIYPSIGSMILTARILNLLFFMISMFFIIKFAKAYQFIFVAISITPVVIQHATSLSYDNYNYIACAFMFMASLNIAIDIMQKKVIPLRTFIVQLFFPSIVLYFSKMNSKLLFLIIPVILFVLLARKLNFSFTKKSGLFLFFLMLITGMALFYFRFTSDSLMIVKKLIYSLIEPYYTVLSTEIISGTATAAIPNWLYGFQVAILVLLFLSYEKERVPKWFTFGAASLVLLNFLAVMISYAADSSFIDYAGRIITGPQGRYFTPFLLLLAPLGTLLAKKISVKQSPWLIRLVLAMSVFTLMMTLGLLSIRLYQLHLPADEWRSGIHHYIFK